MSNRPLNKPKQQSPLPVMSSLRFFSTPEKLLSPPPIGFNNQSPSLDSSNSNSNNISRWLFSGSTMRPPTSLVRREAATPIEAAADQKKKAQETPTILHLAIPPSSIPFPRPLRKTTNKSKTSLILHPKEYSQPVESIQLNCPQERIHHET